MASPAPHPGKLLEMRNIRVAYGAAKALDGIDFDLYEGEVHGLIGEHRAGKSTLVKAVCGAVRCDGGTIVLPYCRPSPAGSDRPPERVGIVYQELTIIPHLNAVENIFLGNMTRSPFRAIDHESMRRRAEEIFDYLGFAIDLKVPVYRLKRMQQHIVEFAKAIAIDPRILILDELANKLTPEEMETAYRVMLDLKDKGCGVIYISHNIDEILRLTDRVTILKGGHRILTADTDQIDKLRLFELTYSYRLDEQQEFRDEAPLFRLKRNLQSVIQHLPVGVLLLDGAGCVCLYNMAANEICGLGNEGSSSGSFFDILAGIAKGDEGIEGLRRAFREGEPFDRDDLKTKSGKTVRLHGEPQFDRNGTRIGTLVVAEDISLDLYLSEYMLEKAKMTTLAQLAVGVAHEINNPLFVIQNYLEVIKGKNADAGLEEHIGKIEREIGRIVEIVSSLLSFSRKKGSGFGVVDLREVMDTVLILLHYSLSEKSIEVTKDYSPGAAQVAGDENQLTQLFLNLVSNAIDAVLIGGAIEVGLRQAENGTVIAEVSDDGCGIPSDIAGEVFDPFFTTKLSKKNTGLGLSICRHIAEVHEGAISFESEPGRGTTFSVLLPGARFEDGTT